MAWLENRETRCLGPLGAPFSFSADQKYVVWSFRSALPAWVPNPGRGPEWEYSLAAVDVARGASGSSVTPVSIDVSRDAGSSSAVALRRTAFWRIAVEVLRNHSSCAAASATRAPARASSWLLMAARLAAVARRRASVSFLFRAVSKAVFTMIATATSAIARRMYAPEPVVCVISMCYSRCAVIARLEARMRCGLSR